MRRINLDRAAELLEFSLEGRKSVRYGANSGLAKDIKKSSEYDLAYKLFLSACSPGYNDVKAWWKDNIDYGGGDLYYAVTPSREVEKGCGLHARIKIKGTLCKDCGKRKGVSNVRLRVEVNSNYDYEEWRFVKEKDVGESEEEAKRRAENYSKHKDLIKYFEWTAQFKDDRP